MVRTGNSTESNQQFPVLKNQIREFLHPELSKKVQMDWNYV